MPLFRVTLLATVPRGEYRSPRVVRGGVVPFGSMRCGEDSAYVFSLVRAPSGRIATQRAIASVVTSGGGAVSVQPYDVNRFKLRGGLRRIRRLDGVGPYLDRDEY